MNHKVRSQYLNWVKTRRPGRFNLASSGVISYPIAELDVRIQDLELNAPDPNGPERHGYAPLQEAIATYCGVSADCVVSASGTSMANFLVLAALIQPGDEVLIEEPVYEPLLAAAHYCGALIRRLKRQFDEGFQLPPPEEVITPRTKLIVITNLHNPSCVRIPEATLRQYGEAARAVGARVLVDEVYLECLYEKNSSAFHYGPEFVVTSSLTKAYGLGGLRCGWILADADLAQRLWGMKDLIDSTEPHPTELLSIIAFGQIGRIAERARILLGRNRSLVRDLMGACPQIQCVLPDSGTCVFPTVKGIDGDGFVSLLHDRYETDVVPGRFFGMPNHFRLGLTAETAILAAGLERLKMATHDVVRG
jgi:aspartate/methionine/tyrosine aminotransferase